MQVWKARIFSGRKPDFVEVRSEREKFQNQKGKKVEQARQFCFLNGWVGIGWGLDKITRNHTNHREYIAALRKSSFGKEAGHRSNNFANEMKVGDLVWCRTKSDIYWIGKIKGPWQYKASGRFKDFDLYQVRKCDWKLVGTGDSVPGRVKNSFSGRGLAISRIPDAQESSADVWRRLTGGGKSIGRGKLNQLPISSIAHDYLEDIVALYLQKQHDWYVIPSTGKRSNPTTEFVLRNEKGKVAFVQVKAGKRTIDSVIDVPDGVDVFYVFDPSIDKRAPKLRMHSKVKVISNREIEKFIAANKKLMPNIL